MPVALVTGGAHRVGRGIVLALAASGHDVVVHYGSSADEAEHTAADVRDLGREAMTYSADLRDPDAIAALFRAVEDRFEQLDVLVNSAALFDSQPFDAIMVEDWDRSMAVNVRAPFLCSQHAARLMDDGVIVNISDLFGVQADPRYIQHGVSKAGLIHLTKVTARALAPDIRVNAIVPGAILPPPGVDAESERWQQTLGRIPLERTGSPELVGETVVFLVNNPFITGEILHLDGGERLLSG